MPIESRVLFAADRGHILRSMASFAGKSAAHWLSLGHPAQNGSLPTEWRHVNALAPRVLVEAVAAAAPNHCIDSWSYAARAISAFLSGDLHAARHLAYYAQLRAGLSLLGNLGIGIFNRINFVVTATGRIERLDPTRRSSQAGLGTHDVVWEALDLWVSEATAAKNFLELVRIGGAPLSTLVSAIWPGAGASSVAGRLIEAWGLDLKRGKDDHRARNMSSYNPQALALMPDDAHERIEFIECLWSLFEPTASSSFDLLDRHLLRSMLWEQHHIVSPEALRSEGAIDRRYEELPRSVQYIATKDFLIGRAEPAEPLLLIAAKSDVSPALPHEMIARAVLLCRAATAFTMSNFTDAGIHNGSGGLRAWIDPIAEARGFWKPSAPLASPSDLWLDLELALEELAGSKTPKPSSMYDWMDKSPVGLPTIAQAERIGIWGLGS